MYKAVILPLTKQDIKEAAHWYNEQQSGLGNQFTAQVRKKVKYICENPQAIAIRYDLTRTALIDIFPYMIHFIINESEKQVVISGVFNTSRNPKIWKRKE